MEQMSLDGRWKAVARPLSCVGTRGLKQLKTTRTGWIAADVPGEIHLDLMRAGKMEEPLVSTNAARSRWPEKKSWWYRTTFDVPRELLEAGASGTRLRRH